MRVFDEIVFAGPVVGTTAVYSHPFFDPLLSVGDDLVVEAVCSYTSGAYVRVRIDLEHSNDGLHWLPKCGLVTPTALTSAAVVVATGADDSLWPTAAFARLRLSLAGDAPAATVEVRACMRQGWAPVRVRWTADFTGHVQGSLTRLPGGLALARASAATVRTSIVTVTTNGIAANVARVGDDGSHTGLVLEESRENKISYARDITAGPWTTGLSVVTTANAADGPDGTASIADRSEVAKDGYSNYFGVTNATAGYYTMSQWYKRGSVAASAQIVLYVDSTGSFVASGGDAPEAWQRIAVTKNHASGDVYASPANGLDGTAGGGVLNAARDVLTDLMQLEFAQFATEAIVTSGAAATRAGERLYLVDVATLLDAGRMNLEISVQPRGASSEFANDISVWTIDGNNYATIQQSNRKLKVVIAATSYEFTTALSWSAGDTVDLWIEAGGGSLLSKAQYRVNGGTPVDLGASGSAHSAISSGVAIDLLCSGTASQWTAWVRRIRAYWNGSRPSWLA